MILSFHFRCVKRIGAMADRISYYAILWMLRVLTLILFDGNECQSNKQMAATYKHTQTNSHGKHSIYAYDAVVQSSLWYNTADKGLVRLCAPHNVEPLQWKNVNIIDLT